MRWRISTILVPVCALGLFASLAVTMRQAQQEAVASALDEASTRGPRPVAEVASAVRALKLVTVEIEAKVKVEKSSESWRGDVTASVEMPVRLHYGTDLSTLGDGRVSFEAFPHPGTYIVRIPRATRLATEVFTSQEVALVRTGWMRLRSRAGEYYLGLARQSASDEARALTLLPDDAQRVRDVTREQVAALVCTLVGPEANIEVRFDDEP